MQGPADSRPARSFGGESRSSYDPPSHPEVVARTVPEEVEADRTALDPEVVRTLEAGADRTVVAEEVGRTAVVVAEGGVHRRSDPVGFDRTDPEEEHRHHKEWAERVDYTRQVRGWMTGNPLAEVEVVREEEEARRSRR